MIYAFWVTMPKAGQLALIHPKRKSRQKRTLNILHALLEDLVQNLRVLQLLLDLGNDAGRELLLLAHLDLALVADPRVEHVLGLVRQSSLLLHLVGLGLELSGLLSCSLASDLPVWANNKNMP